ncbi:MAG: hypothetical protein ACYC1C_04600 [Chloroflexota bacterium]
MAKNLEQRADQVTYSFEQGPDEVYLGISMASIFTAIGLYMTGHRDNAFMVGMLGTSFAVTGLLLKLIGMTRGRVS